MCRLKIGSHEIGDIDLVVFDRDGTLIDLYHYWSNMIGLRADLIAGRYALGGEDKINLMFAMGVDVQHRRLRPEGPVGLKKREIVMQAAADYLHCKGIAGAEAMSARIAFVRLIWQSLSRMKDLVKLLPGAAELLLALRAAGGQVAIATTDREERCRITMEAAGLLDVFSAIVGSDSVAQGKPAPDMINLITAKLGIDQGRTVMVGDASSDVQMGLNAGVRASVGVCSGLTDRATLCGLTPYVIDDVCQIRVL